MRKTIIPLCIFLIGVISIIADTIIYGEYTGVPHTIYGFVGCFLMCVMMVIMVCKS